MKPNTTQEYASKPTIINLYLCSEITTFTTCTSPRHPFVRAAHETRKNIKNTTQDVQRSTNDILHTFLFFQHREIFFLRRGPTRKDSIIDYSQRINLCVVFTRKGFI